VPPQRSWTRRIRWTNGLRPVTGKDGPDVSRIPESQLVASVIVMDKSAEYREDHDYLITVQNVRDFEEERGPLPERAWLLFRSGWGARIRDEAAHTQEPDFDVECAC
jgi:kynurenine formamidase